MIEVGRGMADLTATLGTLLLVGFDRDILRVLCRKYRSFAIPSDVQLVSGLGRALLAAGAALGENAEIRAQNEP